MSNEQNKAIVRRYMEEVWGKGNVDVLNELADQDVVDHNPLPNQAPGIDGQRQALNLFRSAFTDLRVNIDQLIADGDKVVDHWTTSGRHTGDFMGIPASGKSFTFTGTDISRLSNGKIVELWHVEDVASLMQQIGAMPNAPGAQPPMQQGRGSRSQPGMGTPPM